MPIRQPSHADQRVSTAARLSRIGVAAGVLGWLGSLVAGIGINAKYEVQPGPSALAPKTWPSAMRAIPRPVDRPVVVLIAHPRCPCTRATIANLREVMSEGPSAANVYVLFDTPTDPDSDWTDTELCCSARAIGGVSVVIDRGGLLARQFGARTSGAVVAYDAGGMLVFRGGITPARGHEGPGNGLDSLRSLLRGQTPSVLETPVFGCELVVPSGACGNVQESGR